MKKQALIIASLAALCAVRAEAQTKVGHYPTWRSGITYYATGSVAPSAPFKVAQDQTTTNTASFTTNPVNTVASCTSGTIIAIAASGGSNNTALSDSSGGAYTLVSTVNDHGGITTYRRLIGASPVTAGVTTFTFGTGAANPQSVYVECFPGMNTISTAGDGMADIGFKNGTFSTPPSPITIDTGGYSLIGFVSQVADLTIATSGGWTQIDTHTDTGGYRHVIGLYSGAAGSSTVTYTTTATSYVNATWGGVKP